MNEFIFFLNKVVIDGSVIGGIYALGAIGVTLIFGILRFAHFAHGDMMTLGAGLSLAIAVVLSQAGLSTPLPLGFIAMPIAMALTAAIAVGIDRIVYKPLREAGARPVVLVMASVGVMLMIQGLVRFFAGSKMRSFYFSERKDIFRIHLPFIAAHKPLVIAEPQILLIILTVAVVIALHIFLTRTRDGKAMRAMSDNADLARITGIDTARVVRLTWIIGGALACAGGTMLSLDVVFKPDLSFNILLPIFAAAIVGGIGKPYGAIAGGFLVGFSETLAVFNWSILLRPFKGYVPHWLHVPANLSLIPTEYKITVPFFILIVVLIWRPTGLFKGRVI